MKFFAKIAIVTLVLAGCENVANFPKEPFIELTSYEVVAQGVDPDAPGPHVKVKFYFTDGDGNLGLDDNDLAPPHCDTCAHYDNLFVDVNSKVNGVFEKSFDYNSRLKNLTPEAQNKTLEGHMTYKIDIANRASDTLRIDIYLEDRDLNKSNTISTPTIFIDL